VVGAAHGNGTATLVAGGQACFLVMMGSCLAIKPSELAVKRGLSFYGNHLETIVPYAIGFALCIGLTAAAVARFSAGSSDGRRLRAALAAVLGLMALVPLTPYSVDLVLDYLHITISALLFALAFALGAWLGLRLLPKRVARAAFAVQAVAGSFALSAQLGWHDYMIPSQLVFQLALTVLVVLGIARFGPAPR
jgi:hypothetical protein